MATKSISQLDTQATANETDLFEVAIVDANSASGYASKKESAAAIADAIVGEYQYPLRITGTTAKTIAGAINELKNLVDLLPQFAIEVVQTLPVSDISETTIYLVPTQDPEQGNYYEEYIYVNNAWELVGTTAVDLSGYYTSAQVDTLLAAKADSASLATVATSGAYSDLSGKPTIDTALDTTSTNAVENRAVASEINSIKSDITVEGSASGDIATFVDGSDNPLKELKISIVATQSGTGDPSPENKRPISGWTGCDVIKSKKNLLNVPTPIIIESASNIGNVSCVLKSGTYCFATKTSTSTAFQLSVWNSNNEQLANISSPTGSSDFHYRSFTITETSAYIRCYYNGACTVEAMQIEKGDTYTGYEPYNGETINIDWENEVGTVYGAQLDFKNGLLTQTWKSVIYDGSDDENWQVQTTAGFFINAADKKIGKDNYLADNYTATDGNAWDIYATPVGTFSGHPTLTRVYFRYPYEGFAADLTAWRTWLASNNVHVIYELATPVTYQLTPIEIRSLLGTNNVWADCGAITELKYTRDLNLCINNIIARIEALEGGSNTRSLSLSPTLTKSIVSDSDTAEGILEGKTEETEEETKEEAQKNER